MSKKNKSTYINFEEDYQKNKNNKDKKSNSGLIDFEAEYQADIFRNSLPSRLENWEKERNTLYDSYKSRFYDKDGKFINTYRQDTKSAYDSYLESQKKLDTEAQQILSFLDNNGSYFDEKYATQLKSYLTENRGNLSSLLETYKSDNDYWGQWADEDAYNRDLDQYNYSNKYKGKTYADLMNEKELVKRKATKATGDDLDALNRELYWLENHKTDRQFADTMTTEELEQYKEGNEAKKKELQAKVSKLKTEKMAHERGGQTANARYKTVLKELESAEKELKGLGDNSSVLYYDETGAVTVDNILTSRENEEILTKIKGDENARVSYDKALEAAKKLEAVKASISAEKIPSQELLAEEKRLQGIIDEFESLGYDFDSLQHYQGWKTDRENLAKKQAEGEQYAKEHPVAATVQSILTAPLTPFEYAQNLVDANKYGYSNIYDDQNIMQNEMYQNTVSTMIGDKVYEATGSEVASWLASTAYSGATSAVSSGMTALACTAMFGGAGTYVASAIMGMESASSSYRSAIMNGSTNGQAILYSVASGTAEAFFEYASLDKLVGNVLKAGWNTETLSAFFKSALKNSGKVFGQGLVEASEEFATEISNKLADSIINGNTSAYETAIRKYKSQGYSDMDAKEMAQNDYVMDIINSAVGGFFGGIAAGGAVNSFNMGLAGASTVSNIVDENKFYNQQGQSIIESGNVGELVESAKSLPNGSKSLQKLANKIAGVKTKEGLTDKQNKKYSKDVGKLYKGVQKANLEGVKDAKRVTFKSMVKAELESNKDIKTIDKVADIITKAQFETLTPAEQKTFDKVDGLKVLNTVNNSKKLNSDTYKKTKEKNIENFVNTGNLTINEKQAIAEGTGYDISDDGKNYIEATDEEVSVKKFESVGNDDIVVELDNGSSISVGELRVNKDIAVIANGLKTLNTEFGVDVDTANYIYGMWQSVSSNSKANEFMLGVVSAMEYGRMNNEKGLDNTTFVKDLPAEFRKKLFDMARESYQANTDAQQKAIDKAVETRKQSGKGKARAEGTGTVKYDGIKESDLDSKQKAQADLISTVMSVMGINVEFFASPVKDGRHIGESGSYNPNTNTIRIDIFAGNDGQGIMLYTASHELTHFIRKWSPAKFKTFADFLMQNYNENNVPVKELIKAKMNNAKLNGRTLSYDAAYEEIVADACEKFLADSNAKDVLVSLAQKDQSLAQKVLQWIKDFVNLIKNALDALKGVEPDSQEAKYVQEMTDALEKLHSLWDEALFDAMESYQWVGKTVSTKEIAGIDYEALEAAKNENGEELFQYRAIQHDVPEYRALLEKCSNLDKVEIDNLFSMMEKAFAIIGENLEILDYAWDENLNEDGTWDDSKDVRAFKPVKPNSDKLYKYSLDFSTLCRKRLLQQVIVEELSMALDRAVTKAESIAIRDELIKLQEEGRQLEIACALCYVESARMKSPEQIQRFLNDAGQKVREFFAAKAKGDVAVAEENARKRLAKQYAKDIKEGKMPSPTETVTTKSGKEKYIALSKLPSKVKTEIQDAKRQAKASYNPTAEEQRIIDIASNLPTSTFTTAEGLKNLAKEQPVIFDAYTSFVRNATHSKGTEKDVWYRVGDADVIGDDLIAAMNKENGLRSQSWSDFQVIHLLDYVGAIIELSTKQAKMQSYTKVEDYVNLMGLTNMMINLSLIPTREFNGKLDFDSVEGMGMKIALELRDKYPSTAGTISIGVADEQIKLLLESMDIDYVIPYHHSAMSKVVRKTMHIPTWDSYQDFQGEKKISSRKDAMANADKYGVQLLSTSDANYHKAPNFSEWFDLELARKTAKYENIRPSDAKAQKKYGVMYGAYKAMQEAADNYIKLCAERGLQPKFSYGKGDFSTEQNYWKLLIDRKMINQKTGEIIEQKAVKPVFKESEVLSILNNEIARYEGVKEDFDYATHYVVERFLNGDMNEHINDIAKHIGETVNNVTKVASVDVEVKHQDRDSEGRNLTKEQAEYFKDSKVRDADGKLIPCYHGTFENFTVFDINKTSYSNIFGKGHYFTSSKNDAEQNYAKERGADVKTKIESLAYFYFEEMGYTEEDLYDNDYVDEWNEAYDRAEAYYESGKVVEVYLNIKNPVYADRYESLYDKDGNFVSERSVEGLKARGFDGIIDYRVSEKFDFQHLDGDTAHYIVFDSNQIKLVDNLNPTENEDIRYQDRVTPEEDAEYMDAYFDGDEDLMQELVDKVANRLGYKYKAYHHTEIGFTVFDLSKARSNMDIQGFFFSADKDAESEYGSVRYDTYLKMNNPYIVDSKEKQQAIPFDMSKNNAGVIAREWLQSQGYDSVIRKAEYFGAEADEYIVFESSQIKSAEAMTFADDEYGEGDVIPLSERFNEGNEDIRYMSRETLDSVAEKLETIGDEEYLKAKSEVPFVLVMKNTPRIVLDTMNDDSNANDRPILVRRDALYLAIRENGIQEGHYHGLGKETIKKLPEYLEKPDVVLKTDSSKTRRLVLSHIDSKNGQAIISVEFESRKTFDGEDNYYNIIITVFDLHENYLKSLFKKHDAEIKYEKEDLKQLNPQLYKWLRTINSKSSVNIISNPTENVNTKFQDRAVSNREILVDAMSNIDELSVEDRNRLAIYREKIDSMNELERELSSVGKQIHEIITTPNSDRSELAKFNAKADTLRKKISRVDGALLKIEAMKPIQNLVEIRKKQIIKAQNQKAQEQRHRNVEGRNKTALKNKIKRVVNELNSLLNNGTKERNVKFELQDTVNKALEMAGYLTTNFSNEEVLMADTMVTLTSEEQKMVTRYKKLIAQRDAYVGRINEQQKQEGNTNYKLIEDIEKMRNTTVKEIKKLEKKLEGVIERNRAKLNEDLVSEAIDSLAASYRALEESQSEFVKGAYSKYVYDRITSFKDSIKGTKMSDMTLVQLQEMYDIYKMVMATVRASNQLFVDGKREDVEKAVSDVLFELDSRNKAKTLPYKAADKTLDIIRDFSYKELKPVYFFERLGSKTLKQIFFDEARKGEDVFARDLYEAYQFAQEKRKQYGYSSWDMDKGYDIKLQSGRTINLKLDELMSIYAYSKREQALEHMSNGGFVFNSKEYFNTDKKSKKTVRVAGGIPYRFNEIDLVKVKQMLTDEQVMFVDEMQGYLTAMGTKGNEVSRALYGIDLFKEKHYFPLMSSKDYITELNQPAGEVSLKNTGMAKATIPHAKNPIVLQGFEDVWASHVNKMSTYHALVLPIENMNKVLNYAEYVGDDVDSVSVKGVIGDLFTKSATDYIKTYIRDLNGGVTTQGATGLFTKHFSKFKKTAVAASLSTVVQQPTAIFRAMAMVNPKYFVGLEKGNYEEIKKYAPIAIIKEMGGFDAGSGRTASSYLLQKTYEGGKDKAKAFFTDEQYRDSYFMWGAEKGDELGWNIIWSAVKKEVADTTTLTKGSEEFLQECGKRFTEVISYTQVYDSVFSRSEYMRSKNDIVKMATAFMGEPTTSFNMLFNAVLQAKRGAMSKGKAIGTVGAIATSIIMAAVAKSFVYALRDDDEDESYLYKYIDSLTSNLASDMLPHNMLPFVKDVTSIFSGWEVERTDMAIFKDLKDAIDGLDSDTKSSYRKIEDLAGAIAAFGGIPVKNVMRTFREGYNLIANVVDDNTGYDGGTPASSEVNAYLEKGKNDKAKETIKEILEDKTEAYVKQGYSKEESAKKAKSALKSSITSYWKELYLEAYDNKDNAEMLRIRKALHATGLYDNVIETCQEWVKNSKNKTEDKTTWNKW